MDAILTIAGCASHSAEKGGMDLYNGRVTDVTAYSEKKEEKTREKKGEKGSEYSNSRAFLYSFGSSQTNPDWREEKGRKLEKR